MFSNATYQLVKLIEQVLVILPQLGCSKKFRIMVQPVGLKGLIFGRVSVQVSIARFIQVIHIEIIEFILTISP